MIYVKYSICVLIMHPACFLTLTARVDLSSSEWFFVLAENSVCSVLVAVSAAKHLGEYDDHDQADEHKHGVQNERPCGGVLVLFVDSLCSILYLFGRLHFTHGVLYVSEVGRVHGECVSHVCKWDTIAFA